MDLFWPSPVVILLVPDLGIKSSLAWLSYVPASLCSLAGQYDNPMPKSTISRKSGTKNLASALCFLPWTCVLGHCTLHSAQSHTSTLYCTLICWNMIGVSHCSLSFSARYAYIHTLHSLVVEHSCTKVCVYMNVAYIAGLWVLWTNPVMIRIRSPLDD